MATTTRKSLEEYLALEYTFHVIAEPEGGFVVVFPDLPGCITQVDTLDELGPMADDARRLWLEAAYEQGDLDIPLPSYPEEHSGKFNLRLPKAAHRRLAESAERDGVSLNTYVTELLGRRDAQAQLERRLATIETHLAAIQESLHCQAVGAYSQAHELPSRP